jgi:hypothetical protein
MSLVTTITIIGCEEDIEAINEATGNKVSICCTDSCQGDKHPQVEIAVGAFNYFDTDKFKADLKKAKLVDRLTVVMVTESDKHEVIQL